MRAAIPVVALILVAMAGCGGGGEGGGSSTPESLSLSSVCAPGSPTASLEYRTRWGSAPQTASQFIRILDRNGNVIRGVSLDRVQGVASSSVRIPDVPPGYYEIRANLYHSPGAAGAVAGVSRQIVRMCGGAASAETENATPVRLVVMPEKATVQNQHSEPFVETARTSGGFAAFLAPNSVVWDVLGGIGTTTNEGWFNASAAGSGSVRAQVQGLSSFASVTVAPVQIRRGKWTVLVYLNAANDLYRESVSNVNQMERVANNPDVRFVVQWKLVKGVFPNSLFDGVRRYLVKPDATEAIASEQLQANLEDSHGNAIDMGSPGTLREFIEWGKANFPADRTVLVIWNHGNGWRRSPDDSEPTRAFSYDDQYGTSIKTWETDEALGDARFEILAWDASLMQMLEVAYEARSHADYIVGSEESPPASGYPYDLVFKPFQDNPSASTRDLSKAFVDGMLNYGSSGRITQSVLDTSKLDALAGAVNRLGSALYDQRSGIGPTVQAVRGVAQSYRLTSTRFYYDLFDLCDELAARSAPGDIVPAATAVRNAIQSAVVWEGHNASAAKSHGVSIDFSPADRFEASRLDYMRLKFAADTSWNEWLAVAP